MQALFLSDIIDLVREGALATEGEVIKVSGVRPLALPLEVLLTTSVEAFVINAVKIGENGNGFARRYIAVQTSDAGGGMVEVDPVSSDEDLSKIAVRLLTGEGMKQVAVLDLAI
jgi:hypothetical protein